MIKYLLQATTKEQTFPLQLKIFRMLPLKSLLYYIYVLLWKKYIFEPKLVLHQVQKNIPRSEEGVLRVHTLSEIMC